MKGIEKRIKRVRMLLLDVDGVMTDGGVILGPGKMELKKFNIQDGMGITLARAAGLRVGILTGRVSEAVRKRARELKIDEVQQGFFHKEEGYLAILGRWGLKDEEIAYMGDDVLDIPILRRVGFAISVANGVPEVKRVSHYVTRKKGGEGAIREVVDLMLKILGKRKAVLTSILSDRKEERK